MEENLIGEKTETLDLYENGAGIASRLGQGEPMYITTLLSLEEELIPQERTGTEVEWRPERFFFRDSSCGSPIDIVPRSIGI